MSTDAQIQSEIEDLKSQFPETKALYREVCALLFFRHGITPTASKLYQFVRKGSMGAPADALAKFWEDLRGKARVQIDHPDLPEELKVAAADAVQVLWGQATELARTELAALRVEAQAQGAQSQAQLEQKCFHAAQLEAQLQEMQLRLEVTLAQAESLKTELESERRSQAAANANSQALQRQVTELQEQKNRARADFSAELERGRAAIEVANERSTAAERRALREIDQERTAKVALEKQLDGLRAKCAEIERQHQTKILEYVTANARIGAELEAAKTAISRVTTAADTQGQQLASAQQQAAQYEAQAQTLRELLEQFKPAAKQPGVKRGKGNST